MTQSFSAWERHDFSISKEMQKSYSKVVIMTLWKTLTDTHKKVKVSEMPPFALRKTRFLKRGQNLLKILITWPLKLYWKLQKLSQSRIKTKQEKIHTNSTSIFMWSFSVFFSFLLCCNVSNLSIISVNFQEFNFKGLSRTTNPPSLTAMKCKWPSWMPRECF